MTSNMKRTVVLAYFVSSCLVIGLILFGIELAINGHSMIGGLIVIGAIPVGLAMTLLLLLPIFCFFSMVPIYGALNNFLSNHGEPQLPLPQMTRWQLASFCVRFWPSVLQQRLSCFWLRIRSARPGPLRWLLPPVSTMPLELQLRENCLKDCLDELSKSWEGTFQKKGARLEMEFEPSIPTFRFDYQRVQQVACNLLDHALYQAVPSGTVTLRCLSRPNGAEVSLTGATEHDQKVFDNCPTPYFRPRNYQESLDVGLGIAKRLILAHGGRIWVEPSSTGSKFVFLLPMNAS